MSKTGTKKVRGLFERTDALGKRCWYISYFDSSGHRHREKAGSYTDAKDLLAIRRADKLRRKKLPEKFRVKAVTFGELA